MQTALVLRKAGAGDLDFLFRLRNHPEVRACSFNTGEISYEGHKEWFRSRLDDPASVIYIICSGDEIIGSVRFETGPDTVKVSVMIHPLFSGKGLGSKALKLGAEKFISEFGNSKPLLAEIKRDNISSIKAFRKAGFRESHLTFVFDPDGGADG